MRVRKKCPSIAHTQQGKSKISQTCVCTLQAVSHQPTSVTIDANVTAFQLYAGGVFDAPCGTKLDHLVLVRSCDTPGVLWLIMCHASNGTTGAAQKKRACQTDLPATCFVLCCITLREHRLAEQMQQQRR